MKLDFLEYKVNRTVYLTDTIDSISACNVQDYIQSIIDEDEDVYTKNVNSLSLISEEVCEAYKKINKFPPIKLVVNCIGGEVNSGLSLYDYIRNLNDNTDHKVDIICQGTIASMATVVILASDNRVATKNTSFLIHSLSDLTFGKIQDMEDNLAECRRLNELMDNIYLSNTNLTSETLDGIDKSKKEWWFGVDKALELGLIKKVL